MTVLATVDPLSTGAEPAAHPYAPRGRRRVRSRDTRPRLAELHGDGLTWIHLERADRRRGAAARAALRLASARHRGRPLAPPAAEGRRLHGGRGDGGYLFAVLHFPVYDKTVGRLNAGELDVFLGPDYLVTLPNVELRPVRRLFRRCDESEEMRRQPLLARLRAAALRGARRPLRLLLPDPRQDRRSSSSRSTRRSTRRRRARGARRATSTR